MADKNYGNNSQLAELVGYISDNMKIPVLGVGGGFAPIGTEAYFDGQVAPLGWVICDGTELNIADYTDLATYYASQHGASNYYGGNGTTTFATPKRSGMPNNEDSVYGDNEHTVGVWRETVDGVLKEKPVYEKKIDGLSVNVPVSSASAPWITLVSINNVETVITIDCFTSARQRINMNEVNINNNYEVQVQGTVEARTINKAILQYTKTSDSWQLPQYGHSADGNGVFCVKATVSDDAGDSNGHNYSTSEQKIGTWIDGSDIYEKTIEFNNMPTATGVVSLNTNVSRINQMVDIKVKWYDKSPDDAQWYIAPRIDSTTVNCATRTIYNPTSNKVIIANMGSNTIDWSNRTERCTCTFRYTKTQS